MTNDHQPVPLSLGQLYQQGYRAGEMDGKAELQQAYDRAMAHNAMLREALGSFETDCITRPYDGGWNIDVFNVELWMNERSKALNATEADAEAWEEAQKAKRHSSVIKYAEELLSAKWALEQQLATVTNERDALLQQMSFCSGPCGQVGPTRLLLDEYHKRSEALAQKGGEECG